MIGQRVLRGIAAALALGLAAGSCAYLDVKQRELIFRATKAPALDAGDTQITRDTTTPGRSLSAPSPEVEEVWLDIPGSADRLHGWWWPAAAGREAPTILYLHGTRRDLAGNAYRLARLSTFGFNILAIDYRGFGRSGGATPDERWTYQDAEVAWAHLRTRAPDPAKRFIYGYSLGGAVAIELATRVTDASGLIVESTFTSIRDMAQLTWARFLPVGLILTQRYDSLAKIENVRIPTLFVHGTGDRWVPYQMSERLYAAAVAPKRLVLVENANHGNALWAGVDRFQQALRELMAIDIATGPTKGGI